MRFTIATTGEKRDGLDLDMTRFHLDNFARNPVLLWMHGHEARGSLPLGRWQNLNRSTTSITGEAVFDQDDEYAIQVERKYRRGFLSAVSVSWLPQRVKDGWRYDMLEASAVGVPADPDALVIGRDFAAAVHEFERAIDEQMELERLVVSIRVDDPPVADSARAERPPIDQMLAELLRKPEAFRAATAKLTTR